MKDEILEKYFAAGKLAATILRESAQESGWAGPTLSWSNPWRVG